MAFRVHKLLIAKIVAALRIVSGSVRSSPIGRYPGYLLIGKLPAHAIVEAKLVEGFGRARQHEDAGTRRHRSSRGDPEQRSEQQRCRRMRHNAPLAGQDGGGGWGTTRCHGPAHLAT